MLYIGFDLGTHCGIAVVDKKGKVKYSACRVLDKDCRLLEWRAFVSSFLLIHQSGEPVICCEQPHAGGKAAMRVLVAMEGILHEIALNFGYGRPKQVNGMKLKKFATGKGNASKAEMMAAASNLAARQITDDNEADAIHVAFWLRNEIEGKP